MDTIIYVALGTAIFVGTFYLSIQLLHFIRKQKQNTIDEISDHRTYRNTAGQHEIPLRIRRYTETFPSDHFATNKSETIYPDDMGSELE